MEPRLLPKLHATNPEFNFQMQSNEKMTGNILLGELFTLMVFSRLQGFQRTEAVRIERVDDSAPHDL